MSLKCHLSDTLAGEDACGWFGGRNFCTTNFHVEVQEFTGDSHRPNAGRSGRKAAPFFCLDQDATGFSGGAILLEGRNGLRKASSKS